ncbi:hypothetical protein OIU76_007733 [Salix suchowensis]|nr:hypothetical protein OIU78_011705 [Salix suchowensis]KAJ6338112.1 hypothetical protein OIU76_007733 [Salix suchowensis]
MDHGNAAIILSFRPLATNALGLRRESAVEGDYVVGKIPRWSERLTKAPSRAVHVRNGIDLSETDTRRLRPSHWKLSVVPARKPSTLGVIYDWGLNGVHHDW